MPRPVRAVPGVIALLLSAAGLRAGQEHPSPRCAVSGRSAEIDFLTGAFFSYADSQGTPAVEAAARLHAHPAGGLIGHLKGSYLHDLRDESTDPTRHRGWLRLSGYLAAGPWELGEDWSLGPMAAFRAEENTPTSLERRLLGALGASVQARAQGWEGWLGPAWYFDELEVDDDLPEERGYDRDLGLAVDSTGAGVLWSFLASRGDPEPWVELEAEGRFLVDRRDVVHSILQEIHVRFPLQRAPRGRSEGRGVSPYVQLTIAAHHLAIDRIDDRNLRGFTWDYYAGLSLGLRF